jgi:N-acyl-D-aspartate/D-glutamate deacylase
MIDMALAADAPLNWNLLSIGKPSGRDLVMARLAASDRAAARGAEIVALTVPRPLQLRLNLRTAIFFNVLPEWQQVFTLPHEDKKRALADPATRRRLQDATGQVGPVGAPLWRFDRMTVQSVASPSLEPLVGRAVGDIAEERGVSPLDAFLDVALAEDLSTCFATGVDDDDRASWEERAHFWQDPRVLIAGSDAGAHLDMLSTFAFYTDFVGPSVRDRHLIRLEDAVSKITDVPARLYGLRDRGRLATGYRADVVVFDPDTVATGDVTLRDDLPGGELRLYADAIGVEHVLVNGVEVVDGGQSTGATPGTVVRSGRDTGARR